MNSEKRVYLLAAVLVALGLVQNFAKVHGNVFDRLSDHSTELAQRVADRVQAAVDERQARIEDFQAERSQVALARAQAKLAVVQSKLACRRGEFAGLSKATHVKIDGVRVMFYDDSDHKTADAEVDPDDFSVDVQ